MSEVAGAKPPGWPIGCFNSQEWAKEFALRHPEIPEDTMIGWFAAAIMTGYDRKAANVDVLIGALQAHDEYMAKHYSDGPTSSALHPDAAANWKRVQDALIMCRKFPNAALGR